MQVESSVPAASPFSSSGSELIRKPGGGLVGRAMHSHGGGDIVEIMSSVQPQGGQVGGSPEVSTKSGPPKTTRFAEPPLSTPAPAPEFSSNPAAAEDAAPKTKRSSRSGILLSAPSRTIKQLVPGKLRRVPSFHRRRGVDRSATAAAHALHGLRFIGGGGAAEWKKVEERFKTLTQHQGGVLYRSQFGQCIGMKKMEEIKKDGEGKTTTGEGEHRDRAQSSGFCCFFGDQNENQQPSPANNGKQPAVDKPDFAGELFDALNRRRPQPAGDGITKDEMKQFWEQINGTSFDTRLQTFFDMVDKNADGTISEEEIKEIILLSASENKLSLIREKADEYARLIMEAMDPDNLGFIDLQDLESLLLKQSLSEQPSQKRRRSSLSRLQTTRITDETAAQPEPNNLQLLQQWLRRVAYFLQDNWRRVWVMLLWLSICAALFAWKFVQYKRRHDVFQVMGYCVCVAKGAAETLKFNMALVLLPVCRNTITWILNHTMISQAVPLAADSLNFHKVVAAGITAGAALHAVSHLACDFPRLLHATDAEYQPLGYYFGFPRPDSYWWFVKGTEGWTGLVMLAIMAAAFTLATPWFRRGRLPEPLKKLAGFNAFWYAHHCFVAVYALLLVHGQSLYLTREWYKKSTWMYLAAPMAVYAGERLTRALRSRVRPAKVLDADVYPENVLSLRFTIDGFRYKSGQYVFLNCADVSPFEWHPFSITSAPQDDYVSVHIQDKGDWTHKLKEIFLEAKNKAPTTMNDGGSAMSNPKWPKVRIDGPYGAPAQDYKQYDVVLLVGTGIGATPMISIIKDILNNVKQLSGGDVEAGSGSGAAPSSSFRTRRAYFYWVTREQGAFEWFHKVMDEVVEADKEGVIELHNHCTTVYEEGDARSFLISVLQSISLQAENGGVDVVSGNHVRTHFARPNWPKVYSRIADNHPDQRVGVFYCGNQGLTKELRQLAQQFSRTSSTKFEFHKEIF